MNRSGLTDIRNIRDIRGLRDSMSGDISGFAEGTQSLDRRDSFRRGFLECGICFSTFDDPKFLPCVHTFCRGCLSGHIRSVCSPANPRFNCPTCRENIEIPNRQVPIDQWADQFKSNFLISNLLGIVSHAGNVTTIQNTLQGKMCYRHPAKPLDFLCVDCDVMICSSCAPTLHRTCLQVITLEEAVEEKRDNFRQFHHAFSAHHDRSQIKMAEQLKEKTELQRQYSMEKQKILQHTAAFVRRIKEEENKCLEELDMAFGKYKRELEAEMSEHKARTVFLKKLRDAAHTLLMGEDHHKAIEQYGTLEKYCVKLSSYKEKTSCEIQTRKMEFQGNSLVIPPIGQLHLEAGIRQIHLSPIEAPPPSPRLSTASSSPDSPKTPGPSGDISPFHGLVTGEAVLSLERIITAKVRGDKNKPSLRDGVAVSGGVLVVTDEENMCVKSFYTHGTKEMQSKLVMEKKPHSICNYVGNMIAVTVPKAKHIAIISVSPNLILQQTVRTDQRYWGIAAVGTDAFAVSTCPGTGEIAINIIDLEGKVLKCIHNGTDLFANPLYMSTQATGDIMVSDCTIPKVSCLRQNGHVLFNCQPTSVCRLKKPMGMADDGKGYLFLVDSQPVLVLMDYGGNIKHVLHKGEGIKDPKGVAIGPKGTVYVINENGRVGVFKLQNSGMSPDSTIPKEIVRS